MRPSPSQATVVACISIGLWCSVASSYSAEIPTGAFASAVSASPRFFGGWKVWRFFDGMNFSASEVSKLVLCGSVS